MARRTHRAKNVILISPISVARSDDLNLAQQYQHLLMTNDIQAVITDGGPSAGIFKFVIKVAENFYDRAYLLIQAENARDACILESSNDQQLKTG